MTKGPKRTYRNQVEDKPVIYVASDLETDRKYAAVARLYLANATAPYHSPGELKTKGKRR